VAISESKVTEAAEALQAEGINPSLAAVRKRMGGTGSYTTISPVLRAWRESKEQRATVSIEMPSEAKGALERAGVEIWSTVTALATEKLTKVQAVAEEAVLNAENERDELSEEIERLEIDLSSKSSNLNDSLVLIESLRDERSKAQETINNLEIKSAEKEKIETELVHVKADNKALVDVRIRLTSEIKDVDIELKESKYRLADIRENFDRLEVEKNKMDTEHRSVISTLIGEKKKLEKEITATEKSNQGFDLQVKKHQVSLDASISKASELKLEVKELRKYLAERDRETGSLAGELKSVGDQNKQLISRVTDLEKSLIELNRVGGKKAK